MSESMHNALLKWLSQWLCIAYSIHEIIQSHGARLWKCFANINLLNKPNKQRVCEFIIEPYIKFEHCLCPPCVVICLYATSPSIPFTFGTHARHSYYPFLHTFDKNDEEGTENHDELTTTEHSLDDDEIWFWPAFEISPQPVSIFQRICTQTNDDRRKKKRAPISSSINPFVVCQSGYSDVSVHCNQHVNKIYAFSSMFTYVCESNPFCHGWLTQTHKHYSNFRFILF